MCEVLSKEFAVGVLGNGFDENGETGCLLVSVRYAGHPGELRGKLPHFRTLTKFSESGAAFG